MKPPDYVALLQPENLGSFRIEDFRHRLHFKMVIAGAECAHLLVLVFLARSETCAGSAPTMRPPSSRPSRSRIVYQRAFRKIVEIRPQSAQ